MMDHNITNCCEIFDENYIFLILSLVLFISYNIYYAIRVVNTPENINIGFNLLVTLFWVRNLLVEGNGGGRILAIQALRNLIMAATFFAGMTITIACFITSSALNISGLRQIQEFILASILLWCFVHWIIAIMGLSQLTLTMSAETYGNNKGYQESDVYLNYDDRIKYSQELIKNIAIHFSIAIRGFFLAFCVFGWVVHPIVCFILTVIVCIYLYFADHSIRKYV